MRLNKVDEIFLAGLMLRWQITAPDDRKEGLLDGHPIQNSQSSRMQYALQKLCVGIEDKCYNALSRYSRRTDGNSFISRDSFWMLAPHLLTSEWYLECKMSLEQKLIILSNLNKIGFSTALTNCVCDFVAGKEIDKYFPTGDESNDILEKCKRDFGEIETDGEKLIITLND